LDAAAEVTATRLSTRVACGFPVGRRGRDRVGICPKWRGSPEKMRIDQANMAPDWDLFDAVIKAEVNSLWTNATWELVYVPYEKKLPQAVILASASAGRMVR